MLDANMYRMFENISKSMSVSFREHDRQYPEAFEKTNFPTRINSTSEVHKLCNWNSAGVFDSLIRHTCGLSDNDIEFICVAMEEFVAFQKTFFPYGLIYLPFEQFYKSLILYKIANSIGVTDNIFEIGPGVGTNSYFFGTKMKKYVSTEVTESFYVLQSMLYSFLFRDEFCDVIWDGVQEYSRCYSTQKQTADIYPAILQNDIAKRVFQYPYWKQDILFQSEDKFELIMSNANLLEMNTEALESYLQLIRHKISNNGYFMFFGCGYGINNDEDYLLNKLYMNDFKPVCLMRGGYSAMFSSTMELSDEPILFSAYGDELKNFFNINKIDNFFKNIYILDDYKNGLFLDKYQFVSRSEAKAIGFKKGFLLHEKKEVIDIFTNIFDELGVENIEKYYTPATLGIFVLPHHKSYSNIDYRSDFPFSYIEKNHIEILDNFCASSEKMLYTREELLSIFEARTYKG